MTFEVENIGDSVNFRAKHTNGSDKFSPEYSTASITTEEIPFVNLYAIPSNTEGYEQSDSTFTFMLENGIHKINANTGVISQAIKTWLPRNSEEDHAAMAWCSGNSSLFRVSDGILQKVSFTGNRVFIEEIDLTYGSAELPSVPKAMAYFVAEDKLILVGDNSLYVITHSSGHYSCELINNNVSLSGLAYLNINEEIFLYGVSDTDNRFVIVDPETGEESEGELTFAEPYTSDYTIGSCLAMTNHNDKIIASVLAHGGDPDPLYFLVEINPEDAVCEVIHVIPEQYGDLTSLYRNETSELVGWAKDRTNGVYKSGLYVIEAVNSETSDQIGELIHIFEQSAYDNNYNIAFNTDDGCLYHLTWRECYGCPEIQVGSESTSTRLVFEKMNPYTLKIEEIELSGYVRGGPLANYYITDGGSDMYDEGNYLSTNLGQIPYTHTVQNNDEEESFVEIADGEVVDGTNYFGTDSEYFTNMYSGLFVMAAYGIDIDYFRIYGQLGADGSGAVEVDVFHITVSNRLFTIFYKSVSENSSYL